MSKNPFISHTKWKTITNFSTSIELSAYSTNLFKNMGKQHNYDFLKELHIVALHILDDRVNQVQGWQLLVRFTL